MMKVVIFAALAFALSTAIPRHAVRYDAKSSSRGRQNSGQGFSFGEQVVANVIAHTPREARLIDVRSSGAISTEVLKGSLIDNATLIRENIVGGFDCNGKKYGYYADQNNDCQIFHVCVPLLQIYPNYTFTENDIMHFAFICPKYTIFSQDAMVCDWERSAIPCESAHELYHLNDRFFIIPEDVEKEGAGQEPIKFQ